MKFVYSFKEGNKSMRELLGGKGANLAEMTRIGLPVPKGFTITTAACLDYYKNSNSINNELETEILNHIKELEKETKKSFGSDKNPLLISVRSGARASMPGMMDTILNLGLNDEVAESFGTMINNKRFVYDSYRRFIQMFADVVMGFPKSSFEHLFDKIKKEKNIKEDTDLSEDDLLYIIKRYKEEYKELAKCEFPQDPNVQLIESVKAVFRSWNNERAKTYRKLNDIPDDWGTAVNIQEMVYGNKNNNSGTGVAFTRNPATGENKLFGEYLINAQGEDVVAGIRTPKSIETLKDVMPKCYDEFLDICKILEEHYKDMQDMEFTIEDGKLYMLQTRNAKRTALAAINIAVDMVNEKKISKEEAIMMVDANTLDQLLHKNFNQKDLKLAKKIASGLAASPGAATGKIYFSAEDAKRAFDDGEKEIILVREETSPEDITGMNIAKGVLTVRGGMTSHAAVVARGMGTTCVSGCNEIIVNEKSKTLTLKDKTVYHEKDYISIDGNTGDVYDGKINTIDDGITDNFETFMMWADELSNLEVRANADNKKDALTARNFGAKGIGLCRTEHMFFDKKRIFSFRKMIVADTLEKRTEALNEILPYQKTDFEDLFRVMKGYNVTIRYLDPPLHEFLPQTEEEIKELANSLNMHTQSLKDRVEGLKEFNPMMGHRGCRLAITYPEIVKMQTKAVIEAAINVSKEGIEVTPEIMIPLVGDVNELKYVKDIVIDIVDEIIEKTGVDIKYQVGTMIEVPRAAITAKKIAKEAEFFSFGTNDLTQMTYGFSRDDAGSFLKDYYAKKIFTSDPFMHLDQEGVGELMKYAIEEARKTRPDISLGICGEHAGDPITIEYCEKLGLSYVSCSPYRVPIARVAAAQATIKFGSQN